jgi:hypothetical protein
MIVPHRMKMMNLVLLHLSPCLVSVFVNTAGIGNAVCNWQPPSLHRIVSICFCLNTNSLKMEHDLPGNIESKFLFLIYFLHYHC